jgi:hypothetical protein
MDLGRHVRLSRGAQDPGRRRVGPDEAAATAADPDVPFQREARMARKHAIDVFGEQPHALATGPFRHGSTPTRWLRYPRSIRRAR